MSKLLSDKMNFHCKASDKTLSFRSLFFFSPLALVIYEIFKLAYSV